MALNASKNVELLKINAKPVLKWAGGKTQLLQSFLELYPEELGNSIRSYIEPFVGGGAVFFDLYNRGLIDRAVLIDRNPELVLLYKSIQSLPNQVVDALYELQRLNYSLSLLERQAFFYQIRDAFNSQRREYYIKENPLRAAQIIFLNKTCFNGLFRVNNKLCFNVPYGNYASPKILDEKNIYSVSDALKIAEIIHNDFECIRNIATPKHFVYYDPPYRPLSKTSSFTAYSGIFDDEQQIRLADLYKDLSQKHIKQMMSNSDPFTMVGDSFFEELYSGFNIARVCAKRSINSNSKGRGAISELVIMNYEI